MAAFSTDQVKPDNTTSAAFGSQRRWSAQIAAGALALQALAFLAAIVYAVILVDWSMPLDELLEIDEAYRAALTVLVMGPVVMALLIAALLVLLRPFAGWTTAQFIQAVLLLIGVQLYFANFDQAILLPAPVRDFLLLGSIVIVIYLNSPEGRLLLVRQAAPATAGTAPPAADHG